MNQPNVAICFHFFYQDLLNQFIPYIDNVLQSESNTDLYITYLDESDIMNTLRKKYPQAILIKSNRGCDTGAFLLHMKHLFESNKKYDYVLKIHTKKNPIWRNQLLKDIAGSTQQVKHIMQLFQEDQSIGMIGVDRWKINIEPANRPFIDCICHRLGLTVKDDASFVGGTIFWMKYELIHKLMQKIYDKVEFEYSLCELGYPMSNQPTYTHSWERIYGLIINHFGYHIKYVACSIDPNEINLNYLPIDFDWKTYLRLNNYAIKPFVKGYDKYLDQITKVTYGVSIEDSIDHTEKLKSYIFSRGRIIDIFNLHIVNILGDPYPGKLKKLFIYQKSKNKPTEIFNEHNGHIISGNYQKYPGSLYLLYDQANKLIINERLAINHYILNGQYEKRSYHTSPFNFNPKTITSPSISPSTLNFGLDLSPNQIQISRGINLMDKFQIKLFAFYNQSHINQKDHLSQTYQTHINYKPNQIIWPHEDINYVDTHMSKLYQKQCDMAKKYGISAFCIEHQWPAVNGCLESLLLASTQNYLPFMFYWTLNSISSDNAKHFNYLILHFLNDKYIKIKNKPVFMLNLIQNINCQELMHNWNELAIQWGFDGIYFIQTLNFSADYQSGFEGYVEWQPNYMFKMTDPDHFNHLDTHYTLVYDKLCYDIKRIDRIKKNYYKGLFVGWNNSLKCESHSKPLIIENATPVNIGLMTEALIDSIIFDVDNHTGDNLIFINAWNNWAEQCAIEPNQITGYQNLEAIKQAIDKYRNPQ